MESVGGTEESNVPSWSLTGWMSPSTSYPENQTPSAVTARTADTFPGSEIGADIELVIASISRATQASGLWRESLTPSAGAVTHTSSAPAATLNAETGSTALTEFATGSIRRRSAPRSSLGPVRFTPATHTAPAPMAISSSYPERPSSGIVATTSPVCGSIRTSEARFCWPWSDRSWNTSTQTASSSAAMALTPSPGSAIRPVTSLVVASTCWITPDRGNPTQTAPPPAATNQGSGSSGVDARTWPVSGSILTRASWPVSPVDARAQTSLASIPILLAASLPGSVTSDTRGLSGEGGGEEGSGGTGSQAGNSPPTPVEVTG